MNAMHATDPVRVSVVICAYNEQDAIVPLIDAVRRALTGFSYEIIVVDDGSHDQTLPRLKQAEGPLTVVELTRNFGQSAALAAGLSVATGKYVATMDGDGQNDPADIPTMLALAQTSGADLVAGIRANRQDGWFLRKLPSQLANRLICRLTGIDHPDFGCTLKVLSYDTVNRMPIYGDKHRFIPALAKAEGARMVSIPVQHHPRLTGRSNYGLGRIPRVLGDLVFITYLLHYRNRPMHAAMRVLMAVVGLAGLGTLLASIGYVGLGMWLLGAAGLGTLAAILLGLGIGADLHQYERYQSRAAQPFVIRHIHRQNPLAA